MKATLREFIVANMMDGSDEGTITMSAAHLADEIVEVVALALLHSLGLEDWAEEYFTGVR